jgi:carboxypeptidase PM20D1
MALRNIDNPFIWPIVRRTLVSDPLREASVRDTISLTMLNAGYKPNVIPERAEAVLDCRLLPGTHQDVFLSNLKRTLADDTIRIEIIQPAQPAKASPTKHALFKAIESAARDVYPNTLVTPYMAIGGTDSRFFRVRGVPAYGLIPILLSKDLVASIHGIDERIPVEALGKAVQVVYHALRRL